MSYPHHVFFWIAGQEPPEDEPAKPAYEPVTAPAPVCCPECWRTEAISPEKAWNAVRAMCGEA